MNPSPPQSKRAMSGFGDEGVTHVHFVYEKFQAPQGSAAGSRLVRLDYLLVDSASDWLELKAPVQHLTRGILVDGELILAPGDMVHRLEPLAGWHNVSLFVSPQGKLRGCYCDVRSPPVLIGENTYACKDLLLDLWIFDDGRYRVLDADEFEGAKAAGWVTAVEYRRAMQTIATLAGWAEQGHFLSHAWPAALTLYKGD